MDRRAGWWRPESVGVRTGAAAACAFAAGSRALDVLVHGAAPASRVLALLVWTVITVLVPLVLALTAQYATRRR